MSIQRPAFVLWLAAYAAAAAMRPGALLELALIGAAGALLLATAQNAFLTWPEITIALLAFALPLLNTFGARAYDFALHSASSVLAAALALPAVLAVVALAQTGRRHSGRAPTLLAATAVAASLGAVVSAALADDRSSAMLDSWWQVWLPILVGAAVLRVHPSTTGGWVALDAVVLAALVPCLVGVAAYVSSFGVPLSVDALVNVKRELSRQFLFQEVTFGNIGHLAGFALLVVPVAIVAAVRARTTVLRSIHTLTAVVALVALVLTVSRLGLAVAILILAALAGLLWRTSPMASVASLVAAAAVAMVLGTVVLSAPAQRYAAGATTAPMRAQGGDDSVAFRESAVRRGLEVAVQNLPFGVGSGRYREYDPVHTAPHSLAIQALAELGVLGALALLGVIGFFVRSLAALGVKRRLDDGGLLVLGASSGALAFLAYGFAAGAPLALGNTNTWASLLALYAALAACPRADRCGA